MNVIYQTIKDIQKDFKSSDNYLNQSQVVELVNQSRGFFGKKTIWNNASNLDEMKRISSKCLFGLKSGIMFTKSGIYFISTLTQINSLCCFPFKKRFEVFKGEKKLFGGSRIYNESEHLWVDLTVLNIIDKWDFPLEKNPDTLQYIPSIEVNGYGIKLTGGLEGTSLKTDELRFFRNLETILKKKSDKKEKLRLNKLKKSHTKIIRELDKDGNGEVDVIEGNDFNTLLKKHQKSILEVDRNYVQQFVKVSSYLKTKKGNIQSIFNSIKDTPNKKVLNEYVEILKDEIHTYNLILFNSLNMIVSLVDDDMITFYEIHEMFDTLNMFDSKHEKDVSQKLTNIGNGLKSLMYEIRDVGNKISNSIKELSYVTKESTRMLNNSLGEINSSLDTNNLLTMIQTYQTYKINKNTKSLRG